MREVGWAEFSMLGTGTIFSRRIQNSDIWETPAWLNGFLLDGEDRPIDYTYVSLGPRSIDEGLFGPPTFDGNSAERWGLYEYNATFAIYGPADIDTLLSMLGAPPVSVIADMMQDSEGITAQAEYRRGKREGTEEERRSILDLIDAKLDMVSTQVKESPHTSGRLTEEMIKSSNTGRLGGMIEALSVVWNLIKKRGEER